MKDIVTTEKQRITKFLSKRMFTLNISKKLCRDHRAI